MNADTFRGLLAAQFPDLAGRPLTELPPKGTDHWLYRIGDDLVARLPRHAAAETQVDSDRWWLPRLAPHLPIPVPAPVAQGAPGHGYPWRWSIVPWIEGENPTRDNIDPDVLARDLAAFIQAMGAIDTTGGPVKTGITRGVPLARRDALTRESIAYLGDRIDGVTATRIWADALAATPAAVPAWIHADIMAGNVLVRDGRLAAVIDFGGLGVGDPALEVMCIDDFFDDLGPFRAALGWDDDAWTRARGWRLSVAVYALADFIDSAPERVADGMDDLAEVMQSFG